MGQCRSNSGVKFLLSGNAFVLSHFGWGSNKIYYSLLIFSPSGKDFVKFASVRVNLFFKVWRNTVVVVRLPLCHSRFPNYMYI